MSTHQRKLRKRAGVRFVKAPKQPTRFEVPRGIGLTSGAEVLAGIVVKGRL